jgi:hypothetical protein
VEDTSSPVEQGFDDNQRAIDDADRAFSDAAADATRDIADVAAVEVITTTAVHLMSAAAVKCGLADDPESQQDLDEARKLINALAGLITAAAPEVSDMHARSLRREMDRSRQLTPRARSNTPQVWHDGHQYVTRSSSAERPNSPRWMVVPQRRQASPPRP